MCEREWRQVHPLPESWSLPVLTREPPSMCPYPFYAAHALRTTEVTPSMKVEQGSGIGRAVTMGSIVQASGSAGKGRSVAAGGSPDASRDMRGDAVKKIV